MKCLLILVFWSTLINYTSAQFCVPSGDGDFISDVYTNPPINDNAVGEIARITVPGITAFTVSNPNQYIAISPLSEEVLVFTLTEAFTQFEENTAVTPFTFVPIGLTITLVCGETTIPMNFVQNIRDINNHLPDFSETEYTYTLPMPFPGQFEITQFNLEITATDIDISNTAIDFSIDTPLLVVTYDGTVDSLGKVHKALVRPIQALEFTERQEFTITARDVREPYHTTTAKLIIEIDSANSVPSTPVFTQAYAEVDYDALTPIGSPPIRLQIMDADSSDCSLQGDISNHFRCEIDDDEAIVTLVSELPEDILELGGYSVIGVTVTKSATRIARTVIIVDIPEPITTTTACPTETTEAASVCDCLTTPPSTTITTTTCPETTTDPTTTSVTCEPCVCTTTTSPAPEDTTTSVCPETTTTTCEPCEATTYTPCTTIPSTEECSCEQCDNSSSTTSAPCTTTPSMEECSCEPCDNNSTSTSTGPGEVTPSTTDCSSVCTTSTTGAESPVTEPCDCSECNVSSSTLPSVTEYPPTCNCSETTESPNFPPVTECSQSSVTPQDCSECDPMSCNGTSTTRPTWDCSSCTTEICEDYVCSSEKPSVTTSRPIASVQFSQESYEFVLAANDVMPSLNWPISAKSTIEEDIVFEADGLPIQLNLDPVTGMLTNNNFLPAGVHGFTVTATGQISAATAETSVTITVQPFEICSDGARVTYTLLVKQVPENQASTLLTAAFEDETDYQLEIESVSPAAGRGLFYVSDDGQSLGCSALDRESNHFAGMDVTQYTVTVLVTEITDTDYITVDEYRNNILHIPSELRVQKRSTKAETSQCVLINDISNDVTRTTIVVVVEDVNDNEPQFAPTNMVIGYPTNSLLSAIAPAYLAQVEATDADIGINAELAYFVESSYVIIHPNSGIIYPTESILDDDFTFSVTARDQGGDGSESSNSLQVQVKILQQEHISVIRLRDVLLEDISEKIAELNSITNTNIRQLQASVLPLESTRQMRADESYYMHITAYVLDNSNNLLTTEQLQELLDDEEGLTVAALSEVMQRNDSSNNTGLIAAVAVLSVILFLLLIGFFVFYFFKLRKNKTYGHMEEQNSDNSTPTAFKKNVAMGRSSSKLSQLGHDSDKPERRPTGILIGSTIGDSDDSPPESPPKERRKSVVFNNNVEQINIVRDEDGVENSKL
ncbi:hypothetical protein Trydic_g22939 [Trypoxylus dichotomus]